MSRRYKYEACEMKLLDAVSDAFGEFQSLAEDLGEVRDALAKLVADPQFLSESNAAQIEMEHVTADEVAKRFIAMISQPPEAIEAMHKYIKLAD